MEKSIEDIWKKGTKDMNEIKIPVVVDVYNRKSIHIMDQIIRRIRLNVKMLVAFGVFFPIYCELFGSPHWISISMALLFLVPAVYTHFEGKQMERIDPADDSYHFLINLRNFLQSMYKKNRKFSKFFYPLALYLTAAFVWTANGRSELTRYILENFYPEVTSLMVAATYWGMVSIGGLLMAIFSNRIYKFDVNLLYSGLFKKLNELIKDMEEMRLHSK